MSKMAVVTGGTKGIGRAIIEKFASYKFDIVTCSRHPTDLEALRIEMESNYGVQVHVLATDMSVKSQVLAFTAFVVALKRPVDVLVNNAGVFIPGKIIDEQEGVFERILQTNVASAYYTTRGLLSAIRSVKGGHIFNMCSIASIMAYPNGGSYSISKFALLGFSKVLREELKSEHIRVTAVLPGATYTDSWSEANLPEERLMKPQDVAEAIFGAYSLSPQSVVEEILIRPQLGDI